VGVILTYKEHLHKIMLKLSKDPFVRFIGYNTRYGHQFNGTLVGCEKSCIEMPVAENLILGLAIGMAMEGYKPIVCIERMDFLWACADALVNHLDKAKHLGWGNLNVIIRTCVCSRQPLDAGCQHTGDYLVAMKYILKNVLVTTNWDEVLRHKGAVMVVEYRKDYEKAV
jgi:pyruvate/2-oxoglutarate/acetoin dehydrogenase E1 component